MNGLVTDSLKKNGGGLLGPIIFASAPDSFYKLSAAKIAKILHK